MPLHSASRLFVVFLLAFSESKSLICNNYNPCEFKGFQPLVQPELLRSKSGFLDVTLNIEVSKFNIEWLEIYRRTYNGGVPARTWLLRRSDTIFLTIRNKLGFPNPGDEIDVNYYRFPNTTNIHTHGLHIDSNDPQDNVFRSVRPHTVGEYIYKIDDEQPSGTYWFHPHYHGATALQSNGGMAGAIIIADERSKTPDYLWNISCPDNCDHDIIMMIQPILVYQDANERGYAQLQRINHDDKHFRLSRFKLANNKTLEEYAEEHIRFYTTNGQLWPTYNIQTGQMKRLRFINGGGNDNLILVIRDVTRSFSCEIFEIANDGVYFDKMVRPRFNKTVVPPGGRADWIVSCQHPGTYEIHSVKADEVENLSFGGFPSYEGRLLRLVVEGDGSMTSLTGEEDSLPRRPHFLRDLTDADVESQFMIELSSDLRINREKFKKFDFDKFSCKVGSVQEWFLVNTAVDAAHPIHLHVNSYQVISYNEFKGPINSLRSNAFYDLYSGQICEKQYSDFRPKQPHHCPSHQDLKFLGHDRRFKAAKRDTIGYVYDKRFRDVIIVPPLSNITVRFVADKFKGQVLVHCHVVMHEDEGMMFTYNVADKGTPLKANIADEDGVYPGQCGKDSIYPFTKMDRLSIPSTPGFKLKFTPQQQQQEPKRKKTKSFEKP